jgi:hypothetical protein
MVFRWVVAPDLSDFYAAICGVFCGRDAVGVADSYRCGFDGFARFDSYWHCVLGG